MSSLLDGIDVAESHSSSKSSGGPNPKIIKGVIAGVLFLVAAFVIGIQFGIIPSPFGPEEVTNRMGEAVEFTPHSQEEVRKLTEQLEKEEAEFVKRGGTIGGS